MFEIICDQCGREILTDYIKVEGYGIFCDFQKEKLWKNMNDTFRYFKNDFDSGGDG